MMLIAPAARVGTACADPSRVGAGLVARARHIVAHVVQIKQAIELDQAIAIAVGQVRAAGVRAAGVRDAGFRGAAIDAVLVGEGVAAGVGGELPAVEDGASAVVVGILSVPGIGYRCRNTKRP